MKRFAWLFIIIGSLPAYAEKVADAHEKVPPSFWGYLFQPKFITMAVIAVIALYLLLSKRMSERLRIPLLIIATFFFGIAGNIPGFLKAYAMHPSAICAATKPFLYGMRLPFAVTIMVMLVLTVIGPKLFCSYVCPVGCAQELAAKATERFKWKLRPVPFRFGLFVRILVFALLIGLSVTMILNTVYEGKTYPLSIYDYINPFHGFEFHLSNNWVDTVVNFLPLILTLILAFRYYRPFCYAVCPVGLFTHWVEQVGVTRLTFVPEKCTECNLCVTETGCPAVPEILKDANMRPDCFACNRCVNVCPTAALKWGTQRTARRLSGDNA